jgi:hypothetical protein
MESMRDPAFPSELILFAPYEESEEQPAARFYSEQADRLVDGLLDIVLAGDDLLCCLQEEEASRFLWAEPHLQRIMSDADTLLKRLAN